jgi:hypothetical protein
VRCTVIRSAWSIRPRRTSSQRASSGMIGKPAASADVQPRGRRRVERSRQVAPEPAVQRPSARRSAKSS